MAVCTPRGISISNLPLLQPNSITPVRSLLPCRTHFSRRSSGVPLRSTTSEETTTPYMVNKHDDGEEKDDDDYDDNQLPQQASDNLQLPKFFEDLKLDYEDTYSVLVFGGGGAVALWLASAVIGAIDSIPVLPQVLELVGLGYTVWFSSRYLIFKKNRDELVARVEQIKQQVLGSKGD